MDKLPKWTVVVLSLTAVLILCLLFTLKTVKSDLREIKTSLAKQRSQVVVSSASSSGSSTSALSGSSSNGKAIFTRSCSSCHSVGKGDLVGPDLKGVVERREIEWLKGFILNPGKMIDAKDPIAMELLGKYKVPMAAMGLNAAEVDEVIAYLKSPEGGATVTEVPVQIQEVKVVDEAQLRSEILKGEALFQGKQKLINGGASCLSCHHVDGGNFLGGGTLAKDLTDAHSRLGSEAIPAILGNPPFPLMKEAYKNHPLEQDEISAILAFLAKTSSVNKTGTKENNFPKIILFSLAGFAQLLLLYGFIWGYRRKNTVNKQLYDRQKNSEKES